MSSIIKNKPLPFKYFFNPETYSRFAKVTKKNAPQAYRINDDWAPYVKRYTNNTYLFLELVDGTIVNTREFKSNPYSFVKHIEVDKPDWGLIAYTRLFEGSKTDLNEVLIAHGGYAKSIYAHANTERTRCIVRVTGGQETLLSTEFDVNEALISYLPEIINNIGYFLRKAMYEILTGGWSDWHAAMLHKQFFGFLESRLSGTEWNMRLREEVTRCKPIPPSEFQREALSRFEKTFENEKDFRTLKRWSHTHDVELLNKMVTFMEEFSSDDRFRTISFRNGIRNSNLKNTKQRIYNAWEGYSIVRGESDWRFKPEGISFIGFCTKHLSDPLYGSAGDDVLWINIYRALAEFKRGNMAFCNPSTVGQDLAKLDRVTKGAMTRTKHPVGFNYYDAGWRLNHLYTSEIAPTLRKLLEKQNG